MSLNINKIGIDISLNSTAIYIESDKGNHILSFTNKSASNTYIKQLEDCGVHFYYIDRKSNIDYSKNEIIKIKSFIETSDLIISEISKFLNLNNKTVCQIEGYSFSKNTSSILDIVALSTLIKSKLLLNIPDINISIIAPKSLKLEACKYVYPPINIGVKKPKYEYRNNEGISGGSFKKHEMLLCMIEGNIDSPILKMMIDNKDLIMGLKKIPNPIEDIVDSIFACKLATNKIFLT